VDFSIATSSEALLKVQRLSVFPSAERQSSWLLSCIANLASGSGAVFRAGVARPGPREPGDMASPDNACTPPLPPGATRPSQPGRSSLGVSLCPTAGGARAAKDPGETAGIRKCRPKTPAIPLDRHPLQT